MTAKVTRSEFWNRVDTPSLGVCWTWTGYKTKDGYGRVKFEGYTWLVHRLAWYLAHGDLSRDLDVCHTCDERSCVNPQHMFLGTHQDNMADMVKKNRHAKGSRSGGSKLTEDQVREIRRLYRDGEATNGELAKKYRIDSASVSRIISYDTWKHVKDVA